MTALDALALVSIHNTEEMKLIQLLRSYNATYTIYHAIAFKDFKQVKKFCTKFLGIFKRI
jgi:hypothetical protein